MASLFQIVDQLLSGYSRESRSNVSGEQIVATLSRALISPLTNQPALQVDDDGSVVASASGQTVISAKGALPNAAVINALLNAVLSLTGGVFQIASAATGTVFPVALYGSDASPNVAVFPAAVALQGYLFTAGSSGQALLRNVETNSIFPVLLSGSDTAPNFVVLAPASPLPAITYQYNAAGQLTLLNQTTGNFLPVIIAGPDTAPSLQITSAY